MSGGEDIRTARQKDNDLRARAYVEGRMSPYEQRLYERRALILANLAKRLAEGEP